MGLVVAALVALLLAYFRVLWGWVTGQPVPQIAVKPAPRGVVMRFLSGLGKVKAPSRVAAGIAARQVNQWRTAALRGTQTAPAAGGNDCEVLVVGAGPNGLMTALLLQMSGVNVRIIDRNEGPATESRAFAVQARTIELFRNLGLADELLRHGIVNSAIKFHIKGRYVGLLDFDRAKAPDTPYPFILMAPQNEVEDVLLAALAERGVHVERHTELVALAQDDDKVHAGLRYDGVVHELSCHYIVGADGAHSAVRKLLGMPFEGGKYTQNYLLADCKVDWPLDHTHFRIFMNGERIGLFLPLKGAELSRVMATDLETTTASDAHGLHREPMTLEDLQSGLSEAMCVPLRLSNPIWTTRYRVHLRSVDRYSLGRGFLVGDAAHIHSPAGGQGMNTGFQDAANLAWKLAAVLRTGAGTDLLESYNDERKPVGIQLLKFTDRLYKITADLQGWRAALRDTLGPFLVGRMSKAPIPHRKSFRRLSQTGLRYRPGHFFQDALLYSMKGPLAGQRAPDARLNGEETLFDLLTGYRTHVLALSRRHLRDDEIAAHVDQLQSIEAFGGNVAVHLVGRVACRRDARVHFVTSPQVFEHYGLTEDDSQALFIVRPDGHVAWRMDEIDYDACRLFLARQHGGLAAYQQQRSKAHSSLPATADVVAEKIN